MDCDGVPIAPEQGRNGTPSHAPPVRRGGLPTVRPSPGVNVALSHRGTVALSHGGAVTPERGHTVARRDRHPVWRGEGVMV